MIQFCDMKKKIIYALFAAVVIFEAPSFFGEKAKIVTPQIEKIVIENAKNDNNVFSEDYSKLVDLKIQELINGKTYTFDEPLVIVNPYGTNQLSGLIYFETDEDLSYSYSIGENGSDEYFTHTNSELTTKHYLQIFALLPSFENSIYIKMYDKNNKVVMYGKSTINTEMLISRNKLPENLKIVESKDAKKLTSGFYFSLLQATNGWGAIYISDNFGHARGLVVFPGQNSAHNIIQLNSETLMFNVGTTSIVEMNLAGKIVKEHILKFPMHHDFALTEEGNILTLSNLGPIEKRGSKPSVVEIDYNTDEVLYSLNFEDLISGYDYTLNNFDWLHLNSIESIDKNSFIVSGREISAIIKINNFHSDSKKIDYMITEDRIYEKQAFDAKQYMLKKVGDFPVILGQHDVRYIDNEDPNDGIYNLTIFNNFNGATNLQSIEKIPYVDWNDIETSINNKERKRKAYFYVIKVDENNKTYSLLNKIEVTDSALRGSARIYNNNYISASSNHFLDEENTDGRVAEYGPDGKKIIEFGLSLPSFFYRSIKINI